MLHAYEQTRISGEYVCKIIALTESAISGGRSTIFWRRPLARYEIYIAALMDDFSLSDCSDFHYEN